MNRFASELLLIPISFIAAIGIPVVFETLHGQMLLFLFLLFFYCFIALSRPVTGAIALLVFQCFQSELRRFAGAIYGFGGSDPLILVAPVATLILLFVLIM